MSVFSHDVDAFYGLNEKKKHAMLRAQRVTLAKVLVVHFCMTLKQYQ
jgi:hypothetical protein